MDASDSTNWNEELIEEYVDEHPHKENRDVTYSGPDDNNNLVKEAIIAVLCNCIVEGISNLGHSKEEAKKIKACADLLAEIIDE